MCLWWNMKVKAKLAAVISIGLLQGCIWPTNLSEIKDKFEHDFDSFVKLNSMIKQERWGANCFHVADNRVGHTRRQGIYWNSDLAFKPKIKNASIKQVLASANLPLERYNTYLELLDDVDGDFIVHCHDKGVTSVPVHRNMGCVTAVKSNQDGKIPKTREEGRFYFKIVPLKSGWYIEEECYS